MHLIIELKDGEGATLFWRSFQSQTEKQLHAVGMLTTRFLQRQLKRVAPRRTGAGARSIMARPASGQRVASGWLWRFFSRFYMLFTVTPGTRSHEIRPKRAKALRFFWAKGPRGPGIYFFKRVMHPGYKPPFDWRKAAIERTRHYLYGLLQKWGQQGRYRFTGILR